MAESYSGQGRKAYKYQFSALPGTHGADVAGYFGPLGAIPTLSLDFQRAFMSKSIIVHVSVPTNTYHAAAIWGNFIKSSDPSISDAIAVGPSSNQTVDTNAASSWPAFSNVAPYQLNLNQTGGTISTGASGLQLTGSSLRNNFTLANAYTWEAGRGKRCDYWRSVAAIVPA